MKLETPLRYPGGKGELTDFVKMVYERNQLLDGHYAEPYAGGAEIALNLLTQGYASNIHLNDLNPGVFAFWHSVIHEPEALCKAISDVNVNRDEWFKQEAILNCPLKHSLLEIGFAVFFLNRINRTTLLWQGQADKVGSDTFRKLDPRFNKDDLIRRIEWIAMFRSGIHLTNLDTTEWIKTKLPLLPENTLVYFDPPYYGSAAVDKSGSSSVDHKQLSMLIGEYLRDRHWIVSYNQSSEINALYSDYPSLEYSIKYGKQGNHRSAETMYLSNKLIIPAVHDPVNLKAA